MAKQDVAGSGNITSGRDATVTTSSGDGGGGKGPIAIGVTIATVVIAVLGWAIQAGLIPTPWTVDEPAVEPAVEDVQLQERMEELNKQLHEEAMKPILVPVEEVKPASEDGAFPPPLPTFSEPPETPSPDACPVCGLKIEEYPTEIDGSVRLILAGDLDGDGWCDLVCGPCADNRDMPPRLTGI